MAAWDMIRFVTMAVGAGCCVLVVFLLIRLLASVALQASQVVALGVEAAKRVESVKVALQDSDERSSRKMDTLAKEKTLVVLTDRTLEGTEKIDILEKTSKATHAFLNSEKGVFLEERARDKHRIAELSGDPKDFEVAEVSDRAYEAHRAAQEVVDSQPGTDAEKKGES